MDSKTDSKRKMDKHSDNDDRRREKRSRRYRSRSRSYEDRERDRERRKRRHSRSRSPNGPVKQERRDDAPTEPIKKAPERKAKETDMLNTRTGGAYIPPARLRMMQAQITDKSSVAYQRLAWEALKKSIHGHINKINVGNIGIIIRELLKENIVRGRGLLCRSVIQAQAASPTFTNVYAALVAAVNSRFPNIGELLLKRLVIQFKRGFKRNDKPTCISSASFIAHLVNQRVAHEILALELLTLLVESPTDDSVEVAIAFLKECGQKLTEVSSKGVNAIFEMLRNILHEGQLDKRVQYMIEVMFQVWKDGFKDHPALIEELELVAEEEQFTHLLMLDDATDPQDILNVFKFDDKYEDNEQKYKTLSKEILGSDAESGEEDGSGESGSEESEDEEEQEGDQKGMTIIDNTETNLVALRRTIYLTINSSLDFEECAHKLMKMQLKPGQEVELCHMFLDCCAEQRTYEKFYGLLAQRFCNINRMYIGPFEEIFKDSYATAHRLDTNRLRNVSKFFAHLLFTDSISWEVMECVKLNEEDTTSSSRIYIKILFQELAEYMGLKKLNDRLRDPTLQDAFSGVFPRDNPKNTRFSINFFTSIGLGGLTDELREHLKQMPKNVPAAVTNINVESDSSSSDSSSSSSSSDSSSSDSSSDESGDENEKNKKSEKSKEKKKSKQSKDAPNEDTSNKENDDKDKRWGHDGFYDTYGENARRYENRQERTEQNRDNFARPRDNSRRYEDRERYKENGRGNTDDRSNRDLDRRRNDRGERNPEEINRKRAETDSGHRRQERERTRERRDSDEYRRNARNAREDSRSDNGRSRKDQSDKYGWSNNDNRSRKDDREDRRQDRNRDNSNNEHTTNRTNRDEDRTPERSNKKEIRDKGIDKNDKVPDNDRNKDKNTKDSSQGRTKDKIMSRDNRDARLTEVKDKSKKTTDKRDKHSVNSDDDDSRKPHKEVRSKVNRMDDENKYKETERTRRDDKGKSNKDDIGNRNNVKEKNKKSSREKENSSEEDSENENKKEKNKTNRNRESEKYKDENKIKKYNSDESNSKNRSKKNKRAKKVDITESSPEESDSESDDENKTKQKKKGKEGSKKKKDISKDRNSSKNKSKHRNKYKDEESSSDSSEESDSSSSSSSSDDENIKTSGRYWDTFDIKDKKTIEKSTKRRAES